MPLEELKKNRLLLPERMWGQKPRATLRTRVTALVTFSLALFAAWVIWVGQGSRLSFLGIGLFLVSLVLILVSTFQAVDVQVKGLEARGLVGKVEGLDAREEGIPGRS